MNKKQLFLPVLILSLFSSFAYAEAVGEYQYPKITLELKGNTIILKHKDNIYTYPSLKKDEYAGIKKVLQEDINGDGKKEYILAIQLQGVKFAYFNDKKIDDLPEFPYGVVLICKKIRNRLDIQHQMILGNCFPDFEFADVDKDGIKDVIATGFEYAHWRHLKIASWQEGKYVHLWDMGEEAFAVKQSFEINEHGVAQINIGYPGEHGYNPEIWETWIWDGKEFKQKQE